MLERGARLFASGKQMKLYRVTSSLRRKVYAEKGGFSRKILVERSVGSPGRVR